VSLELRVLGGIDLRDGERAGYDSVLSRPKRLAILVYLALADSGAFIRRDTLLPLFWPESDESHARSALSQALYVLRGALGSDVIVGRGRDEVGVDGSRLTCDAREFRRLLVSGNPVAALELYSGDLLPGFHLAGSEFERWLEAERVALRSEALGAALALARSAETDGESKPARGYWARALEIAPDSEAAAMGLIAALWRAGRRSAALETYEGFSRLLLSEYGVEPGSELQSLIGRVRDGGSTPGADASAAPGGRDLPHTGAPAESSRSVDPVHSGRSWTRVALPFGLGLAIFALLAMWWGNGAETASRAAYEAHQDYQRAWAAWETNRMDSARHFLHSALDRDPTHARAWALLGYVDLLLTTRDEGVADELLPEARRATERAIELDSTLTAAWHTDATILWFNWDWDGAADAYRRVLDLPYEGTWSALSRVDLASLLADLGQCEEAWEVIEPYAALPPIDRTLGSSIAIRIPYYCRDYARSTRLAEQTIAAGDSSTRVLDFLFRSRLETGDVESAGEALELLRETTGDHPYVRVPEALLLARTGRVSEARRLVVELEQEDPDVLFAGVYGSASEPLAGLRAAVGDLDTAFLILEAAMDSKGHVRRLSSHPQFEPLRDDPRYGPLVARMGLRCRRVGDRQSCQSIE
jgi:DNA-binding SARP family transcriptional activator